MQIPSEQSQPSTPEFTKKDFFNAVERNELGDKKVSQWINLAHKTLKGNVTALMVAADKGNLEAVRILLKWGANVNDRDDKGNTAFDYLAGTGEYPDKEKETRTEIVGLLTDAKLSIGSGEWTKGIRG